MVALFSMFIMVGIFLSMLLFTDVDSPSPSFYGWFCYVFLLIAAWPPMLCVFVLHRDPSTVTFLLLFVISGSFWASVVEVFFELKKRYKSRHENPVA